MPLRSFSSQRSENATASRTVDDDAPLGLRQEFVDAMYLLFERTQQPIQERKLYNIISQSLGIQPSGEPYGGFRYAIGRDVNKAPWERFYDLIIRVGAEVPPLFKAEYHLLVNQLLAAYRIAWELRDDRLHRVVPAAIAIHTEAAFRELSQPRFAAALASFREGIAAYDDRPQRGKDACKNVFDALESVAKTVGNMPSATFGNVLADIRKNQFLSGETLASLQKLYDLANSHFRHGTTAPFALKPAEIDYFFISCLGAMLLFMRL